MKWLPGAIGDGWLIASYRYLVVAELGSVPDEELRRLTIRRESLNQSAANRIRFIRIGGFVTLHTALAMMGLHFGA